ncbi:MAG: hypothetical protein GX974_02715 [Clostridiales bacterium]|nr:hypothetical protein [Clostridiales bacterium]
MRRLAVIFMVFLIILTGCAGQDKAGDLVNDRDINDTDGIEKKDSQNLNDMKDAKGDKEDEAKEDLEGEDIGYVFEVNNIEIAMHQEAGPILESLGEPMDEFEADSCAFQGKERVYTYSGFEIYTYEKDGEDYVASVVFLDDSITTKEGVYLFSNIDEAIKIYGDDYIKEDNSYKYSQGRSQFVLIFEDNEIVSIEYLAMPD